MSDDAELLRRYVSEKSEAAFRELVEQHLGFVYHTALRHLDGDVHAAEDVAQEVFTDLARKAGTLADRPLLAGWLHTSTRFAALHFRRTNRRRAAREQEAQLMHELTRETESTADWWQLRPIIDDALLSLEPEDREAVLMRYFESRDFAAIGYRLRLSADGARSRVDRAVGKMRAVLERRGLTCTLAALASTLSTHAAAAPPAGLSVSIAADAMRATVVGAVGPMGALALMSGSSILLAATLAANAVLAVLYTKAASAVPEPPSPRLIRSLLSKPSAADPAQPKQVVDFSNPYAVGRMLKSEGFPDAAVSFGIKSVIWREYREGPGTFEALAARRKPWNQDPHVELRGTASSDSQVQVAQQLAAESKRIKEVLADFGYDAQGGPIHADHPFLPAEKLPAIRQVEDDFRTAIASARADRDQLTTQMESRIESILTPAEAAVYFRENSEAALKMRQEMSELDLPSDLLATLADEAIASDRRIRNLRTAPGEGSVGELRLSLIERYRQLLGDDRFVQVMNAFGGDFDPVDAIYRDAKLPAPTRAERYIATLRFLTNRGSARDDPAGIALSADQLRQSLKSGLMPEQAGIFDATRVGTRLAQLSNGQP